MDYRVEQLAARAGVSVDTIRFYQGRGLLPPPRRRGRVAVYGDAHLERLRRIRAWARQGLPLAVIKRMLDRPSDPEADERLLAAVAGERLGARTLSRPELAAESGVPEPLLRAAESAGLLEPLRVDGEERFSEADLAMARAGLALLSAGFPLQDLLALSVDHARETQELADRAIELFDAHVRQGTGGRKADAEAVVHAFETLLPEATRLVALHFQRTLVTHALRRLAKTRDQEALRRALAAVESGHLEVAWR